MSNPYHDAEGKFCSRSEMLGAIQGAVETGDFRSYSSLRHDLHRADFDQETEYLKLKRSAGAEEAAAHIPENLSGQENPVYFPTNLPDQDLPRARQVRRGLNAEEETLSPHLVQLDNEGQYLRDRLTDDEEGAIGWYQGTSHSLINGYLRDDRAGLVRRYRDDYGNDSDPSEDKLEDLARIAQRGVGQVDTLFAKAQRPEHNKRVLWRVVAVSSAEKPSEWISTHYPTGSTVTEKTFLSTSADSDSVLLHSGLKNSERRGQAVVFEILTDQGLALHDPGSTRGHISRYEREVLLDRGGRFEVLGTHQATFESSWQGGRPPTGSMIRDAPKRARVTVVQLRQIP